MPFNTSHANIHTVRMQGDCYRNKVYWIDKYTVTSTAGEYNY